MVLLHMVRLDSTNSTEAFESFIMIINKGSFWGLSNRGALPSVIKIPKA